MAGVFSHLLSSLGRALSLSQRHTLPLSQDLVEAEAARGLFGDDCDLGSNAPENSDSGGTDDGADNPPSSASGTAADADGTAATSATNAPSSSSSSACVDLPPTEITLSLASLQTQLNLRPEVAETLCCYLEHTHLASLSQARYGIVEITFVPGPMSASGSGSSNNNPYSYSKGRGAASGGSTNNSASTSKPPEGTPAELAKLSEVIAAFVALVQGRQAAERAAKKKPTSSNGNSSNNNSGSSDSATGNSTSHDSAILSLGSGVTAVKRDNKGRTVIRASIDDLVSHLHCQYIGAVRAAVDAAKQLSAAEEGGRFGVSTSSTGTGSGDISSDNGAAAATDAGAAAATAEGCRAANSDCPRTSPEPVSSSSSTASSKDAAKIARLREKLYAAAGRADALSRCLTHPSVMRELMSLQSAGRVLVAWSDWGLGLCVSRTSGLWEAAEEAISAASAANSSGSHSGSAAASRLAPYITHLTRRMNTCSSLAVDRLAQVQALLGGLALRSWQHAWDPAAAAAASSTVAAGSSSSSSSSSSGAPTSPSGNGASPVAACDALLRAIDAYLDNAQQQRQQQQPVPHVQPTPALSSSQAASSSSSAGTEMDVDENKEGVPSSSNAIIGRVALPTSVPAFSSHDSNVPALQMRVAPSAASAAVISNRVPERLLASLVGDVHSALSRMREIVVATLGSGGGGVSSEWDAGGDPLILSGGAGGNDAGGGVVLPRHLISVSQLLGTTASSLSSSSSGPMDTFLQRGASSSNKHSAAGSSASSSCATSNSDGSATALRPLLNGFSVARVLHGIFSPVFTPQDFRPYNPDGGRRGSRWYGGGRPEGLWGRYAAYDFSHVAEVAERVLELEAQRTRRRQSANGGGRF